jgi:hypothetical protein
MSSKVYFAVAENAPMILNGELDESGEFFGTHDITQLVLECAVEYLVMYGQGFKYEFEGAEYCLLAVKIGGNDEA